MRTGGCIIDPIELPAPFAGPPVLQRPTSGFRPVHTNTHLVRSTSTGAAIVEDRASRSADQAARTARRNGPTAAMRYARFARSAVVGNRRKTLRCPATSYGEMIPRGRDDDDDGRVGGAGGEHPSTHRGPRRQAPISGAAGARTAGAPAGRPARRHVPVVRGGGVAARPRGGRGGRRGRHARAGGAGPAGSGARPTGAGP